MINDKWSTHHKNVRNEHFSYEAYSCTYECCTIQMCDVLACYIENILDDTATLKVKQCLWLRYIKESGTFTRSKSLQVVKVYVNRLV